MYLVSTTGQARIINLNNMLLINPGNENASEILNCLVALEPTFENKKGILTNC